MAGFYCLTLQISNPKVCRNLTGALGMRITCIGGGPAGLYFALLMKQQNPAHEVTRDRAQPRRRHLRLGRGVLRPDAGQRCAQADAKTRRADPRVPSTTGTTSTCTSRARTCAPAATASAASAASACSTSCRTAATNWASSCGSRPTCPTTRDIDADLVIAADGLNSRIRSKYADTFQPDIDLRRCRFVWLGTKKLFDAFTFAFEKTERAGSRRTPTGSMTTPPPSSSRRPKRSGRPPGSSDMTPRRRHRLLREAVRASTSTATR